MFRGFAEEKQIVHQQHYALSSALKSYRVARRDPCNAEPVVPPCANGIFLPKTKARQDLAARCKPKHVGVQVQVDLIIWHVLS